MIRNIKSVPRVIFGRGSFDQLDTILDEKRLDSNPSIIFFLDDVFKSSKLKKRLPLNKFDLLLWIKTKKEPTTIYVDELTFEIKLYLKKNKFKKPSGIIGIGGGSTMDLAKAVSVMLTNEGSSESYQGWDLVKNPSIYHVGIPTLSGTGSEISRTSVLTGPKKKLGINSDYSIFDQIILDPEIIKNAPKSQRFYTGMDCYIHCVESLKGSFINTFSKAYGEKAIDLCIEVFLKNREKKDDKLMIASYFGGMSISYSQVGICHAMSYGLSYVMGIRHGLSNCLVFNILDEYYTKEVDIFRKMMKFNNITLPEISIHKLEKKKIEKMIDVALDLTPLWENALGKRWESKISREKLKSLYLKI